MQVLAANKKIISDFSYTFEKDRVYVIMGPNGSGKSTLAHAIAGNPTYTVESGQLIIENENSKINLAKLEPHERAEAGIFLSFQHPLALQGIRVAQLLLLALKGKVSALEIRKKSKTIAKELNISEDLLNRSLNEGASGGERKKMEVLQGAILDRSVQIYDEVDTGVDVDALKSIGQFLHRHKKNKIIIIITHYHRILKYIRPDKVLVLKDGQMIADGGPELAETIEKEGYHKFLVA